MVRTIISIVAGCVWFIGGMFLLTDQLGAFDRSYRLATFDIVAILLGSIVLSIVGGYLTGSIARAVAHRNVSILTILVIVLGSLLVYSRFGSNPLWLQPLLLLVSLYMTPLAIRGRKELRI